MTRYWQTAILAICSGLLTSLAFATHYTGFLVWFSLIPYFYVMYHHVPGWPGNLKTSALFGMSFYVGILHWLPELHPLTWLQGVTYELSLLIVYGGVVGISIIVTLFVCGFGALLGKLQPQGINRVLYPTLLWMLMEWSQGLGEVSLPWARLAMSQYQNLPLLQIISVTGHIFISGLIVAYNATFTALLIDLTATPNPRSWREQPALRWLASLLLVTAGVYGFGWWRLSQAETGMAVSTAVVQGNISQGEKWTTPAEYWHAVERIQGIYLDLSRQAIQAQTKPQLLVWPESAIPVRLREAEHVKQALFAFTRDNHVPLYTGIFDRDAKTDISFNSAVFISDKGEIGDFYNKRQLVPFGEFMPWRTFFGMIPVVNGLVEKINPMQHDLGRGATAGIVESPVGKLGGLICFESVYPQVARASVLAGAEVLLIVTNDGWYKDAISIYQHNAHAVLRAIENDRDVVRAANTGISSFIDHHGHIKGETKALERVYLAGNYIPRQTMSLYTRWGEWPIGVAFGLLLGLGFRRRYVASAS